MVQYVQRRVCVCVNVSQLRLFNANNYNRYNMGVAWQGVNTHPPFCSSHGRIQASAISLLCSTYHLYHVLTWIMFPVQRRLTC